MSSFLSRIVVLAKAPVAGRSKTRLTPPYTPEQAAAIARACLQDTLETVRTLVAESPGIDALICLDGEPGAWLPAGIPVLPQCQGGHDVRIAHAIETSVHPAGLPPADAILLIGMDTPQVTTRLLRDAVRTIRDPGAVMGHARDGGWWLLGLRAREARQASDLITGIPTSTPHTGERQRQRLQEFGLTVRALPVLRDIDTAADIDAVLDDMTYAQRSGRFASEAKQLRGKAAA